MNATRLYHRELGIPEWAKRQIAALPKLNLGYSQHAKRACLDDRFGAILNPLLVYFPVLDHVVEVETVQSQVIKFVVRVPYDAVRDLILAICVDKVAPNHGFVKTLWSNMRSDKHSTLDASKYCRP